LLLEINTPMNPPHWALLERQLLNAQTQACTEFYDHYFDEQGYLLCVPRWGGDDGPDDAAENQLNWTMLYALGADDSLLNLFRIGFEGHLRQYTEAKTVDVPMAREGMYYREFPASLDWFHHGEGYASYFLYGLCDPHDQRYLQRMRRWAAMYMGDDPHTPNYDPEHRVIRSLFNGSRGPMLRKATALDWAGDPIEVAGRFRLGHGEQSYQQMLEHFREYTDVAGDSPLNMEATHLALIVYALTGEQSYRDWLLQYVDAWVERTKENNGIIPSNIGLDGTIGGEAGGRWYGGCYGWAFTVTVPQTGKPAHRPAAYHRAHYGFSHGLLMTGSQSYVDIWRGVIDRVNENSKQIDGQIMYPRMYGDDGWYDYRPQPFDSGALEVWYWSQDRQDLDRLNDNPWIGYLEGNDPGYPKRMLETELGQVREKIELMHRDTATADTRLSDDMNLINPATSDTLNQLTLGGLPTGRNCHTLHCRLRYFDATQRRAGLPQDVGALVESMSDTDVTVTLINLNPVHEQHMIVQGGAYSEHRLQKVTIEDQTTPVDTKYGQNQSAFAVRLAPGCGAKLQITMKRYANRPTLAFPWD